MFGRRVGTNGETLWGARVPALEKKGHPWEEGTGGPQEGLGLRVGSWGSLRCGQTCPTIRLPRSPEAFSKGPQLAGFLGGAPLSRSGAGNVSLDQKFKGSPRNVGGSPRNVREARESNLPPTPASLLSPQAPILSKFIPSKSKSIGLTSGTCSVV